MKRYISLLLTLLLLLPALIGCGAKEEAVFSYDGYTITVSQYRYFLANYKTEILKYHGVSDSASFWTTEIEEGVTMEEYYTPIIDGIVKNYCIAQALFRRYGLTIPAENKQAVNDDINEKIELYGSRAEVNAALAPMGIDIGQLKNIYLLLEKSATVYRHLYGENGIMAASAEEVERYYTENYHRMKYVVFETFENVLDKNGNPTFDSTGTPITVPCSEAEIARKKALLEDIKTRAGLGTESDFDGFIKEYSAVELDEYPTGLYVSSNEAASYGTRIVKALSEMEPGECRIIEEENYLFLIRKYDLIPFENLSEDDITSQLASLEYYTAQTLSAAMYSALYEDVVINATAKATVTLKTVQANKDGNL